jgi:DnaJ-like protein
MPFERIAELRLRQAIADGLLDDLPNRGERLDLNEYFATPEDRRVAYSILKNANCLPEEVEIRNEIIALERVRARATSDADRRRVGQRIADLTLRFDLLRDRSRRR